MLPGMTRVVNTSPVGKKGNPHSLNFKPKRIISSKTKPEDGHCQTKEAEGGHDVVQLGVLADSRDDANRDGNDEGDDGNAAHQDHGVGDAAADDAGDGLVLLPMTRIHPSPSAPPRDCRA